MRCAILTTPGLAVPILTFGANDVRGCLSNMFSLATLAVELLSGNMQTVRMSSLRACSSTNNLRSVRFSASTGADGSESEKSIPAASTELQVCHAFVLPLLEIGRMMCVPQGFLAPKSISAD